MRTRTKIGDKTSRGSKAAPSSFICHLTHKDNTTKYDREIKVKIANMLTNTFRSRAPLVIRGCSYHTPAACVAFSKVFLSLGWPKYTKDKSRNLCTSTRQHNFLLTKNNCHHKAFPPKSLVQTPSLIDRHCFATQPFICNHDDTFAKHLSVEEFDNAYKFLYAQHNHPRGPWVKVLQSAQQILAGQKTPRILVIASGPGEPAATLATNFRNADIISAHSTVQCVEWANERFNHLGLTNVTPRIIPDMQNLDVFADASFDLVASCYGLANAPDPQVALHEIHRVLKPGGTFLASVWEQLPADPGCDIILRHACIGPNPWHKTEDNVDAVGTFRCPVRAKRPMSLSKPHLFETMIENAKFSLVQVTHDEYPLKLGNTKEKAFKALCLPIRAELQQLKAANHYHPSDAAESFEDILNEGFMVKQLESGEMEVPYNVYKYVVARRSFEDDDLKKDIKHTKLTRNNPTNVKKVSPIKPIDVKQDPVIFDTWIRMKPAASDKIANAVKNQIKLYRDKSDMQVLDAAPSPYAETAIEIASDHPSVSVVVTSRSMKVVESIREKVRSRGLSNLNVKTLDSSHLSAFKDKTFDIVICSFGLTFLNSPEQALNELRRVLKPGGSLIISVWEDLCLSQLSDFIVNEMRATGSMEDFAVFDTVNAPDEVLRTLQPYAKPHALENLIVDSGFNLTRVDHETARILLSDANCSSDFGVNVATLPIRPFLRELEKSGENKHAFEGARKAFQTLMNDPSLVSHDKCGNAITTLPSRFKLVTATRRHEDSDGYLDHDKFDSSTQKGKKIFKFNEIPK
ncbi:hypothetical protein HJC23_007130 [Cyclotella cryptica]|uniref:Methyltransferase type 11 domain-containing protein n=1 Tax=Cyclotella cryptica TaxID=29204 RepID=A0ABD3NMI9_9STRA